MGDAYWKYAPESDGRSAGVASAAKRPRSEFNPLMPGSRGVPGFLPRDDIRLDDRGGRSLLRETGPLGPAYDRYMQNGIPPYGTSGLPAAGDLGGVGAAGLGRAVGAGLPRSALDDSVLASRRLGIGGIDPGLGGKGGPDVHVFRDPLRRPEEHLPADASSTLFVEGLPAGCSRREAAHIFRPFVGFKEVRLVNKERKPPGGDPIVLCFVDFCDARRAATALEALQGYKFDESDPESPSLRLQFARSPGPRGGSSASRDRGDYAYRSRS